MELNFQFAHHEFDESESRPLARIDEALIAFDDFDWADQIKQANELKKCSPTLSLILERNKHMIWVSGFGNNAESGFVSECCFPGEVPRFLGFGRKQGTVSLYSQNLSHQQARKALELFINRAYEELSSLYENA
ncbi:MAG: hypothetical protein AAF431_12390 [Pseudomonadota bacterium]